MITLEQIKLLEGKITRAIELIRVLKEENSTLRRGLDSAQKRMKELESLVEGFKADQKEIESVIVRTLRNLDELEEAAAGTPAGTPTGTPAGSPRKPSPAETPAATRKADIAEPGRGAKTAVLHAAPAEQAEPASKKDELDIF